MSPFQLAILLNMRQRIPQTPFQFSNHLDASVSLVTHCSASPIDHSFHSLSLTRFSCFQNVLLAQHPPVPWLQPRKGWTLLMVLLLLTVHPCYSHSSNSSNTLFHWEDVLPGGILRSYVMLVHLAVSVQFSKKSLYLFKWKWKPFTGVQADTATFPLVQKTFTELIPCLYLRQYF